MKTYGYCYAARMWYLHARLFLSLVGCEDYDGTRVGIRRALDIAWPHKARRDTP